MSENNLNPFSVNKVANSPNVVTPSVASSSATKEVSSSKYNLAADFTDENTCVQIGSDTASLDNLSESDIELIKKELRRKIDESKDELADKKETRGWLSSFCNGVANIFGNGDKKAQKNISNNEALLAQIESDPLKISEVYKTIMGKELNLDALDALKSSNQFANSLSKEDNQAIISNLEAQVAGLEAEFKKAQNSNGWISGSWNKFKNWAGVGASSNKTQAEVADLKEQISLLKEGKADLATVYKNISGNDLNSENLNAILSDKDGAGLKNLSKAGQSVNKYSEGQKMCTDVVGDIVSGVAAVGAVALGCALGICAAPFTGGASLGLVAAAFGIAAGTGAVTKILVKSSDCLGNEKEYSLKDAGYDVVTGGLNGAAAPLTNALGGAAGTSIMKACGQEALETTVKSSAFVAAKEVAEESVEQIGKGAIKASLGRRIVASGADMVIDGSLSGFVDGSSRALAEGRFEDILKDGTTGFVGGAIASPIIGAGFKGAGKLGSKLGGELSDALDDKFTQRAIKKCLTTSGDTYVVKADGLSVSLHKNELSDEILKAIDNGDNTPIYKYAQGVIKEETVYKPIKLDVKTKTGQDIGNITADDLSKLSPDARNLAVEFINKNIPPSKAADVAVLYRAKPDVIDDLLSNQKVAEYPYYVSDLAILGDAERKAALAAIDEGVSIPSAISEAKDLASGKMTAEMIINSEKGMKNPITPKVEEDLSVLAKKLSDEFEANKNISKNDYGTFINSENGITLKDSNTKLFGTRPKGESSVLAKLKSKYEAGKLTLVGSDEQIYIKAKKAIGDAYGARLQLPSLSSDELASSLQKFGYTSSGASDEFMVVIQKVSKGEPLAYSELGYLKVLDDLKEKQNKPIFDALCTEIENGLEITELNNYGNKISSYFTDSQVQQIRDIYYNKRGKNLTTVTLNADNFRTQQYNKALDELQILAMQNGEDITSITSDDIAKYIDVSSKGAVKGSGYTSAQMNITQGDDMFSEFQIRGIEINKFGDVEHIPYDIRQGKITAKNVEYADIYNLFIDMSDTSFDYYNTYLSKVYEYLRLKELGITIGDFPILDANKLKYRDGTKIARQDADKLTYNGLLKFGH
ncbi:hypothetical protein IKA15_00665 [bacterium]|nr:hypothetical protein [bacterium]